METAEISASTESTTKPIKLTGNNLDLITSISFKNGTNQFKPEPPKEGSAFCPEGATCEVQVNTKGLKEGDYNLVYNIKEVPGKNLPSGSPISVKVAEATESAPAPTPAKAKTTISIIGAPTTTNKKITFKIKVTGGASSGSKAQMLVGLTEASVKPSGPSVLVGAGGTPTLTSASLPSAKYVVQAQYLGDATHASSKSASKTISVP